MKPLEKHNLALPHAGWFLQTSPVCTKIIKFSAESMQYHTVSSSNRSRHAHPNMTPTDHQSLRHLLLKPLHLGKLSSITHVLGSHASVRRAIQYNVCWLLLPHHPQFDDLSSIAPMDVFRNVSMPMARPTSGISMARLPWSNRWRRRCRTSPWDIDWWSGRPTRRGATRPDAATGPRWWCGVGRWWDN